MPMILRPKRPGGGWSVVLPLLILLVLSGAGCSLFNGSIPPEARRDAATARGFELLDEKKWSYAMGAFRDALELDENHAPAHYGLGRVFIETGYLDGAEREFERAKAIDESYGPAYLGLAHLYFRQDRFVEAEENVMAAESHGADDSAEALYMLGLFAERRDQHGEAEERFRRALEASPSESEIRLSLVDLLRSQKRYDDALTELERETFPQSEEKAVRLRLADCRLHLGQDLEAERLFRQLVHDDRLWEEPLWGLAILALRRGDPDEVSEQLEVLARIVPAEEEEAVLSLVDALDTEDPLFVFLGRCRDLLPSAGENLRTCLEAMIQELSGSAE